MLCSSGTLVMESMARSRDLGRPKVVIVAHKEGARTELKVHPKGSGSWTRRAEIEVVRHVDKFRALRRVSATVARDLDEGRTRRLPQMQAYVHRLYRVREDTATDPMHDRAWNKPLSRVKGLCAPRVRKRWSAMEQSPLGRDHKEELALDQVKRMHWIRAPTSAARRSASSSSRSTGSHILVRQIKGVVSAKVKERIKEGQSGRGKGDEG